MTHRAIICLGSNVSPRAERLRDAFEFISGFGSVEEETEAKESADVTGRSLPYLNKVISLRTHLTLFQLKQLFQDFEIKEGRRSSRWGPGEITIDIDIIIWDGDIISPTDFSQPYFSLLYNLLPAAL